MVINNTLNNLALFWEIVVEIWKLNWKLIVIKKILKVLKVFNKILKQLTKI